MPRPTILQSPGATVATASSYVSAVPSAAGEIPASASSEGARIAVEIRLRKHNAA
jgi:hypothetical protein